MPRLEQPLTVPTAWGDDLTLIFEDVCPKPNGRGIHLRVAVWAQTMGERPNRYHVVVGGHRVALLKTAKGAISRAESEVAR